MRHLLLAGFTGLFLSLAFVMAGCGDTFRTGDASERLRVESTDSAGVTVVHTFSPDLPLHLNSERELVLGGRDTPEESFYVVGSATVGTDRRGNLYVLDTDARRVQVFNSSGQHVQTLGSQGGGPGELQFPAALVAAEDGRVWVVDIGKRALVGWEPNGGVMQEEPLPQEYGGGHVSWTPAGMVVRLRDMDGRRLSLVSQSGESITLASLPRGETSTLQLSSCGMAFNGMEPIFSPNFVWTASGSTVVTARNPEYVLDFYDSGRHVKSLRRDVPLRPASAELAQASLGEGMRVRIDGGELLCDPAEVVEQQGYAPHLPMVGAVAQAPDGTLWVRRHTVGPEPGPVDLFDPEGHYLGTLPEDSPFPIGFLPDGRMVASEKDELDVERLVIRTVAITEPDGT